MTSILISEAKKPQSKENLSSKLSVAKKAKNIKRRRRKIVGAKSEDSSSNDIWNINPVMSTIFAYTDFKDLVKFNIVCKKWNQLTNPVIHKSIKLLRERAIMNKFHGKRLNKAAKADAEAGECIANNSKHASLIKKFTFNQKLKPQRIIEFFDTFKFITHLTIEYIEMSQDQFLGIVKPLNRLEELELGYVGIKKAIKNRVYTDPIQLPSTLTKLTLNGVYTKRNPELFIQTINSHINLKEFRVELWSESKFLAPFYKLYPSLKIFDYSQLDSKNSQILLNILKFNPQLLELHLKSDRLDNKIISHINRYLINLEELSLANYSSWSDLESSLLSKFTKPTKIKKLKVSYDELSESSLDSILLNTPHLKDLDVQLPKEWKDWIKVISSRCANLECLTIYPIDQVSDCKLSEYFEDYNNWEFLCGNLAFKSTLTNLTLNQTDFEKSKPQILETFSKLKSVKFCSQSMHCRPKKDKINLNMDLWPNFKLRKYENAKHYFDIELIKI